MNKEILRPQNKPAPVQQKPVECLDCGSHNVGIPATYDSLVNSVKAQPEQEQNEFELRGKLATLKCWHRLSQEEEEDLLSFAAAQLAQEPVAWMTINGYGEEDDIHYENPEGHLIEGWTYKPLYTHPPQRTWVGLTDEEVASFDVHAVVDAECVRAIEAKLKEKNFDTN